MPTLNDMLERGYFPKELPACFNSRSFASVATGGRVRLPGEFEAAAACVETKPVRYSLARSGHIRRRLSIPNPVAEFRISDLLVKHWPRLAAQCAASPFSLTTPRDGTPAQRALEMTHGFEKRTARRCSDRAGGRFLVQADLVECYPSLYTHAIAWAVDTKPAAKASRERLSRTASGLLGNDLDHVVQRSNGGHTKGIPIGPDSSLAIAELVLSACDQRLHSELPGAKGFRVLDDYELVFRTLSEAERAVAVLESVFREFELACNPRKTGIKELPTALLDSRVRCLDPLSISDKPKQQQAKDLIAFFEAVFECARASPGESAVAYAVGRFRRVLVDPGNWPLLTGLLLQAALFEPGALGQIAQLLDHAFVAGAPIPLLDVEQTVNLLIERHAPAAHSSEVAWSLWLALRLGLQVSPAAGVLISLMQDPVVAILALDAHAAGRAGTVDPSKWLGRMTTESLRNEFWLLAYEASIQGWLPSADGGDHVGADGIFGFLRSNRVSFYERVTAAVPPGGAHPLGVAFNVLPNLAGGVLPAETPIAEPTATGAGVSVVQEETAPSDLWFYF